MDKPIQLNRWIDPQTGRPARPLSILPCLVNIRHGKITAVPDGFGQHWDKVFQVRLFRCSTTPEELVDLWKSEFKKFWPKGNLFFQPEAGVANGEIGLLKMTIPGRSTPFLATGVIIGSVTPVSFTYTALAGHPVAGTMTFRAERDGQDVLLQAHGSLRASDPLYEIMIRLFGEKEDLFWRATLENLANYIGMPYEYSMQVQLVDRNVLWKNAMNIYYNAGIRSVVYKLTYPIRLINYSLRAAKRSQP